MSEQPGPSDDKNIDPRLLSPGTGSEVNLQELVSRAQEIRKTMSSKENTQNKAGKDNTVKNHGVSRELITKVDSILSIVQNLQTNQREIYNYVRAMAPKHGTIRTEGPIEHFEIVNQTGEDSDNKYIEKLKQAIRKSKH